MNTRDEQRAAMIEALRDLMVAAQTFDARAISTARANAIAIYDRATTDLSLLDPGACKQKA